MNKYLILLIFLLPFSAFSQENAFEKAKKYFQNDTLKLNALAFLENNIDAHYSLKCYYTDSLGQKVDFDEFSYSNFNESQEQVTNRKLKLFTEKIEDKSVLTADNLIEIINRAFENWNRQWNKNLSFDDFCNYLLPYKIQSEPIENWQPIFENRFSYLGNGLNLPSEICKNVNNSLKTWFFSSWSFEKRETPFCLSPSQMLFRKQGYCQDLCALSAYVMRSLGVACSVDFTPAWATSSYDHSWCSFIDENGKHRAFEGVTGNADDFVIFREPSKVFRIAYAKQPSALAMQVPENEIPNSHLRRKNIIDVTDKYWRTTSAKFFLFSKIKNSEKQAIAGQARNDRAFNVAYLSVFNGLAWRVADWAKIENDSATFNKISVGAVYLPMNFENKKLSPVGFPVLINANKTVKELKINKQKPINITVTEAPQYLFYRIGKKYTFYYWDEKWVNAGTKTATESKVLTFDNIPSNTIYLLVPEYSQKKERIFTVKENGEIERW
ncbi:MAG: transglutaminase domain-containing protein [Prevotellaceae bacterium]|jgi:hypothetical protein|nr:transglutaminase domain-containing protein [Prevotellaceae bacterium]